MIHLPADFDIQGHRGCRGLLPENTLSAFAKAISLGVTTIEFDMVITRDEKVLVSHDPFFHHEITTLKDGSCLTEQNQTDYNIYSMLYADVKAIDVGTKKHPRFPFQQNLPEHKPLLSEVINLAEKANPAIRYNGEIKSTPEGDTLFHPSVDTFCKLVINEILVFNIEKKFLIQSFDKRALEYIHTHYPDFELSFLSENGKTLEENLSLLSFLPEVYSPDYHQLTKEDVVRAHNLGIKVIPWTVNTKKEIESLITMGVDGIITDYPDLFFE